MAGERPFKQQGRIPFTWEIRPGVPRDGPEQQHQRHGSSSDRTSFFDDEQYCKKKSNSNIIASSSSGRFQSDQAQKKPRSRTRSRSLMGIYNFFTARVSPFVGEKDKVKTSSDVETKSSSCSTVKKSSSKRSFSSGRWSSSFGSHDVQWSAFGYH